MPPRRSIWLLRLPVSPSIVQPSLPVERLAHDVVKIVAGRLPAKHAPRAVSLSHDGGRISRPPPGDLDRKIDAGHPFDDLDDLLDRLPVPITAVADDARPACAQVSERAQMRIDEVADLDIIAHASVVAGGIVLAEDLYFWMNSKCRLDGALDEVGGVRRRLAETALGIGAGDIEIAQRNVAEIVGLGRIVEHPFDHELRPPIR